MSDGPAEVIAPKNDTFGQPIKPPKNMSKKAYKEFVSQTRKIQWDKKGGESVEGEVLLEGPKRKIAILMSYSGRKYHGLQHNPGHEEIDTIEKRIFTAMIKAKIVYSNVLEHRKKAGYQSCSRTDKGVSAIGNVASLKCVLVDDLEDKINEHLPDDIRITGVQRVTGGFDAKNKCSHRTYSYFCPTFCFAEPSHWDEPEKFRITNERLEFVDSYLKKYEGTKSYHNFTSGKKQGDMSAKRHIVSFEVFGKPFLHSDWEYVELRVKGQSFMIHQIRKMVGLVIARASGHCQDDHWERCFSAPFEDIPKAPGNGLILRQVHFDQYNKDWAHMHGAVDWVASQQKMDNFVKTKILPEMFECDIEENSMITWLKTVSTHDFTGVRAKEQFEKQEFERKERLKRKTEDQTERIEPKLPKSDCLDNNE